MWVSMLLKLISNPKNLAIILLSILLIISAGSAFYYKQKVATLQSEVKVLKVDNENLKTQIKQINNHNGALRKQIEDLQTIEKTSKDLQKRLDALKKTCSQVITIKKPVVTPKPPTIVEPGTTQLPKPKVDLILVPPPVPETKTETVEQSKETSQEVVEYTWGGPVYEKEVIDIHNAIISWFNSSGVRNDKTSSSCPDYSLSIPGQASLKVNGSEQDSLRTG